jgi:3-mercaptopyruvate sulfurtransferase SseA
VSNRPSAGWVAVLVLFAVFAVVGVQAAARAGIVPAGADAQAVRGEPASAQVPGAHGQAASAVPANPEDVPRISQADFKALHASGKVLTVDVRDAGSYRTGHIPGAVSIPFEDVQAHLQELKAAKKPIVTYCG